MSDVTPDPPVHAAGILHYRIHGIPVVPVALGSAALIAAILIYRKVKSGSASAAVASTANTGTSTSPALPDSSGDDSGAWANLGGGASYDGVTTSTNSNTSNYSTNAAWANNAINGLVGQTALGNNTYSPIDIQNALENEINGVPLASALQQEIVNAAIAAYGEPPQPISQTTPAASTATVTTGFHPYVTKTGDTLDSIIQATYGQVDPSILAAVFAANPLPIQSSDKSGQNYISITAASNAANAPSATAQSSLRPGVPINLPIYSAGTLP